MPLLMRRATIGLAAVGALLSGCPGDLEHPERFNFTMDAGDVCPDVEVKIFRDSCGGAGSCHENPGAQNGLDLVAPNLPDRMKGSSTCANRPLKQLIIEKLKGTQGACGNPMPPGTPLDPPVIKCVEAYLADGGA
jgi:hypothetical protein